MTENPIASIEHHFTAVDDPRIDRTKLHPLVDIMVSAICAVICGADNWVATETFGRAKYAWFKKFLTLPHGIPAHDPFGQICGTLDPTQFQPCFLEWLIAVSPLPPGQVIALDGQTWRRSPDHTLGKKAIVMGRVWATANNLVLGQRQVDEKSNEITALPEWLRVLERNGCITTIDAMRCQQEIAAEIIPQRGDYVCRFHLSHTPKVSESRITRHSSQAKGSASWK